MDLKEMLRKEQEELEKFVESVNAEVAYRRGRIKMLEELLAKELENDKTIVDQEAGS